MKNRNSKNLATMATFCERKERGATSPFQPGDRVVVPGRFRCLVVRQCVATRYGWRVSADFDSGFGFYEGYATEFEKEYTF
jgi:threonine dehydrogenase-like Zn-dependent dehydrogenase